MAEDTESEFGSSLMRGRGQKASFNCEHGQDIWPFWALVSLSEIRGFELITLKVLSSEVQRALTLTWDPPPLEAPPLCSPRGLSTTEQQHPLHREPSLQAAGCPGGDFWGRLCHSGSSKAQLSRASPSQEQQGWPRPQRKPPILYLFKYIWDWNI